MYRLIKRFVGYLPIILIVGASIYLIFRDLGNMAFNPDEAVYAGQAGIWAGYEEYRLNFMPYSRTASNFQIYQLLTALCFKVFGISEWSARFISAIAGVTTVILVYIIGRELLGHRCGLLASLLFSISPYWVLLSRQCHLDTLMVFFLCFAVLCLIKWTKSNSTIYFSAFVVFSILSVLTKVLAIIPILAIYPLFLYQTRSCHKFKKYLFKPLPILILMIAFLSVLLYIFSFVGLSEFIRTLTVKARESKPIFFYVDVLVCLQGIPMLILAIFGMISAIKYRKAGGILCLGWFGIVFLICTFLPSKGYLYMLSGLPALCLLAGETAGLIRTSFKHFLNFFKSVILLALITTSVAVCVFQSLNVPNASLSVGSVRFNPPKYNALRETSIWLKENTPPNAGIAVYRFADHHAVAFYSERPVYTILIRAGMYMPKNDGAIITLNPPNMSELISSGKVSYIICIRGQKRILEDLFKDYELETFYSCKDIIVWSIQGTE